MYRWIDVEGRTAADVVDEILQHLAQQQHQGTALGEGEGRGGRAGKEPLGPGGGTCMRRTAVDVQIAIMQHLVHIQAQGTALGEESNRGVAKWQTEQVSLGRFGKGRRSGTRA